MQERIVKNNNELVTHAPELVNEAFERFDFKDIDGLSVEKLIETLFTAESNYGAKPVNDRDRDSWLNVLGLCYAGHYSQENMLGQDLPSKEKFVFDLQSQLLAHQNKIGDAWKEISTEGQLDRGYSRFKEYAFKHKNDHKPFPWVKVAAGAVICLVRIDHPEYQK